MFIKQYSYYNYTDQFHRILSTERCHVVVVSVSPVHPHSNDMLLVVLYVIYVII